MKFCKPFLSGSLGTIAAACFLIGAHSANAQGPGGGGFSMPPEIKAKIDAWRKWNESHKNITAVNDLLFQINEMEKDSSAKLDKKQSATMLKIMDSWNSKPAMSDDQAKSVNKQISGMLTLKQLKKINTIPAPSARMRGGGRPGGGAPGGPGGGGPGGGRPGGPGGGPPGRFTFPDPPAKGWNPFNPDTMPFERARPAMKKRMEDLRSDLTKTAKG